MSGPSARLIPQSPDLLSVHRNAPEAWPYLLASEAGAPSLARWSILFRQAGKKLLSHAVDGSSDDFLAGLRLALIESKAYSGTGTVSSLPFCGGWFVYLGYELAGQIEQSLGLPDDGQGLPVAFAARCPAALVFDHLKHQCWLVAESSEWLEKTTAELAELRQGPEQPLSSLPLLTIQADSPDRFISGVERIREWILSGDVFQVNLSRGWRVWAEADLDAVDLYRALAAANPAPFAGLARLPGGTVISSSPERLVEVRDDQVQTRPIAGTRPRGDNSAQDNDLSTELLAHPKERAEHIMLIDLERNDLGRVCVSGSVEVNELMAIESYTHVHHIVSNVRGQLRPDRDAVDVIAAVFPGGTITGCPKVRCMEIIAELEKVGRGFYTGSMGYIGHDGSMDLNILIRSMCVSGREIRFRTGAGIVADSGPKAELAETKAKARGLLRALGVN